MSKMSKATAQKKSPKAKNTSVENEFTNDLDTDLEITSEKKEDIELTSDDETDTVITAEADELEPALKELFLSSIKDIYWAENHLVKTLPKMEKAATSESLKAAINKHLGETKVHVQRLESIFELLGKKPQAKKCDAMEGITMEGEEILEETKAGTATRDVGIILASQKVEHYEIATYGGLAQLASTIGEAEIADILKQTLEEEKLADQKLTEVAENDINFQASEE